MSREEREREHFNRVAREVDQESLEMPKENIQRYASPPQETPYALEFAFHLLGDLRGATVVELGCGDGLNTVILAALGASVIGVDISEESLALTVARARANGVAARVRAIHASALQLPLTACSADKVLCVAILHHVDAHAAAAEIQRVLKPGGVAVFLEPMEGPPALRLLKRMIPKSAGVSPDERPLSGSEVHSVERTVGGGRRRRAFGLTHRIMDRIELRSDRLEQMSLHLDRWLFAHLRITRHLASPLVWEAVKTHATPVVDRSVGAPATQQETVGDYRPGIVNVSAESR